MHLLKRAGRTVVAALLLLGTSTAGSAAANVEDEAGPAEVESVLAEQLGTSRIPGGAYVIVGEDGTTAGGAGTAADGQEVSATTPFVIGSTTKSFTALAVLQLVDSGDVNLDTAVREYVPELRLADGEPVDQITVRHVLQQTSGLSDAAGGPLLGSAADGTALDAVAELRNARLVSEPGDEWLYANANYVLAGLVVERASGLSYPDYMKSRIFEPLGMTDTFADARAAGVGGAGVEGATRGHRFWFGVPVASGPVQREATVAAGYIVSTAEDMGRYLRMYLDDGVGPDGRPVVSPDSLSLLLTPGPGAQLGPWADGVESHYAMGWLVEGPWAADGRFHPGNSPDSSAMITLFPQRGMAVATMLNAGHELPVPGNPALTDRVSRNVVHAALGEPVPPAPSLRTLYLVFDLVTLVLVGAAVLGVVRAVRALGNRGRPSRPAVRWTGVAVRLAVAALIVAAPFAAFGWAELWTWAPDLALVLAALSLLLTLTAGVRAAALLRHRGNQAGSAPGGRSALRQPFAGSSGADAAVGSTDAHAGR